MYTYCKSAGTRGKINMHSLAYFLMTHTVHSKLICIKQCKVPIHQVYTTTRQEKYFFLYSQKQRYRLFDKPDPGMHELCSPN